MIRRGRTEGWLKRPVDTLPAWAEFNDVTFNSIKIGPVPGLEHRGSAVISDRDLVGGKEDFLMRVPKELIVSRQNIELFAKSDLHLKEALEAAGDFGRVRLINSTSASLMATADDSGCSAHLSTHAGYYCVSLYQRCRGAKSVERVAYTSLTFISRSNGVQIYQVPSGRITAHLLDGRGKRAPHWNNPNASCSSQVE